MTDSSSAPAATRHPPSAGAILARSFTRFADHVAVRDATRSLTYRRLGEQAYRIADALRRAGGQRGDRVVLVMANRIEFFEVDYALMTGGFVRVALSTRSHELEIARIVRDCAAHSVVIDAHWVNRLAPLLADIESVKNVVAVGDGPAGPAIPYEDFKAGGLVDPAEPPAGSDIAALLYTSGTTGSPKGAMLTHANWAAMMRNSMAELSPIDETDTVLHVAPLSHFSGYVGPTYSARGASHFVVDRFDPEGALQLIDREAITTVPLVPTMLGDLVLAAEETLVDASSLRTIVYGGSAIAPSRLARAIKIFGLVFVQFYGLSEMPMPLTALRARDHDFDLSLPPPPRLASAGRVNPYVELKLICPGGNEEVATGEVGEIVVRGDTVMRGYWGNAQATSETIDADGWAATGDLGVLSQDGFLTIVDRRKDMIVSGGFNVYPAEIEHVIETLRPVREVAVIGVPDERLGEAVKAVVVTRPGQEVTATEVMDACAAQLARYKVPRSIDFVDSLPKTGSGKIMRRALRHRYWEQRERQIGA